MSRRNETVDNSPRSSKASIASVLNPEPTLPPATVFPDRVWRNGREYLRWRGRDHHLPCDEHEGERERVLTHLLLRQPFGDVSPFQSRLRQVPQMVLDVAAGTGEWALEMIGYAERHGWPTLVFVFDLLLPGSPCWRGPEPSPQLKVRSPVDFEDDTWADFPRQSMDLLRIAFLCGHVRDRLALYRTSRSYTKPGGLIESVKLDYTPRVPSGGREPRDLDVLIKWHSELLDASDRAGTPMALPENNEDLLEQAGFVGISRHTYRLRLRPPKEDISLEEVVCSQAFASILGTVEAGFNDDHRVPINGLESLSMDFLCQQLGRSREYVVDLCRGATKVLMGDNESMHDLYLNIVVWTARAPELRAANPVVSRHGDGQRFNLTKM